MAIPENFSFKKGMGQVSSDRVPAVRSAIIIALGNISLAAYYSRLKGEVEPKASEYLKIEEIFHAEGITEIWG